MTKKDFWDKAGVIISFLAFLVAIVALFFSTSVNIELNEFKSNLVETVKLLANNATIENIEGVQCIVYQSGGKMCSGS